MIILLGMLVVSGPNSLLIISEIPLPGQVPGWYPLFAYMAWLLGGFAFFPLLQAFPYESLKDVPKRYVLPLVAVVSASIYNDAFLTGVLRWDDIIFFGFLFTVAYHEARNSIGLALAYALAESGVWYVVAMTWGTTVFEAAILARMALSSISVAVLVFWYLGRRYMFTVMKFHGQFSPSERGFDPISRTNFKTLKRLCQKSTRGDVTDPSGGAC